jgi:phosphatidate cytidylyltransferase
VLSRIITALIGLAMVVPTLLYGGELGVEVLCAVAVLIAADEFARMAAPDDKRAIPALMVLMGAVYATIIWAPAWAMAVLAAATLSTFLYGLLLVHETAEGEKIATRMAAGLLYVSVLISFIPQVRRFDEGLTWIFLILVVTWLGDTGAYFAGRAFGKTKLFERVSPKKTWEGAIGGAVAAVIGACVVKAVGLPELPWVHAIVLGLLLDVSGVVGDLTESLLKRSFGVKDSGWIMPGHGGVLDRIDSVIFSAPVAWIYVTAFGLG